MLQSPLLNIYISFYWQHIDDLTTAIGSVDLSDVKNMEDPKLVEKVND